MKARSLSTATIPIFDDSEASKNAADGSEKLSAGRASQQERVEAIMGDGRWHTLPELQKELKRRFGALHGEASISARLRDMRKRGFDVDRERTRPGSALCQYRARPLTYIEVLAFEAAADEFLASNTETVVGPAVTA